MKFLEMAIVNAVFCRESATNTVVVEFKSSIRQRKSEISSSEKFLKINLIFPFSPSYNTAHIQAVPKFEHQTYV